MIVESILVIVFALVLDLMFGDPKNRYHPTAWIGILISKLVPFTKNQNAKIEKMLGILLTISVCVIVGTLISIYYFGITSLESTAMWDVILLMFSVGTAAILLKTTISIKGMQKHAVMVLEAVERNDLDDARAKLSMIVKRNTKDLDKDHIVSATLESVSENTVDGVTGPMFYFAFFGLFGAFIYRVINTIDSMIGYRTNLFRNVGWFGANCDKILNYLPARMTGLVMILAAIILGQNWKGCYQIMIRDGKKTKSPNAGYPMAALAGALGAKLEKINHYSLGDGTVQLSKQHITSAISLMKLTSVLFCLMFTIPVMITLSYLGWLHA